MAKRGPKQKPFEDQLVPLTYRVKRKHFTEVSLIFDKIILKYRDDLYDKKLIIPAKKIQVYAGGISR